MQFGSSVAVSVASAVAPIQLPHAAGVAVKRKKKKKKKKKGHSRGSVGKGSSAFQFTLP